MAASWKLLASAHGLLASSRDIEAYLKCDVCLFHKVLESLAVFVGRLDTAICGCTSLHQYLHEGMLYIFQLFLYYHEQSCKDMYSNLQIATRHSITGQTRIVKWHKRNWSLLPLGSERHLQDRAGHIKAYSNLSMSGA